MKKPTVGETDKLRALTEDPELRALMEQFYAASAGRLNRSSRPSTRKPTRSTSGLARDDRASRPDGVILRALFIHTLKEARARPDLTEFA